MYFCVPINLVMITNPPMDVTVCIRNTVNIPCGFSGVDTIIVQPTWRINRTDSGSNVFAVGTINADNDSGNDDGLVWVPDLTSGPNNASGSVLVVGPVDETFNQSSYQCSFGALMSETGTVTVAGKCLWYG